MAQPYPFYSVNVEQFVLEIYKIVNPIDDATPEGSYPTTATFSVEPMQPVGRDLDVQWYLDGSAIPGATGTTFDASTLGLPPGGVYTLEVKVVDNTPLVRDEGRRPTGARQWTLTNKGSKGSILFEYYWGTTNFLSSLLNLPTYPDNPDETEWRTSLEGPTNWRDSYGTRVRGYLYPPATGAFTFWIASDDQSELWLSPDEDAANIALIASVPSWTPPRDFDNTGGGAGGPEQRSSPIQLAEGQRYYIEVRHAEGTVGDNLAVAWQGPGIPTRAVIDGQYLAPVAQLTPILSTFTTVLEPNTTSWDTQGISYPFVLYDADKRTYKMWFSTNAPAQYGPRGPKLIAYAESTDGITWPNKTVVYDYGLQGYYLLTGQPWVLKEGPTCRMWFMKYWEGVAGDWSHYISHMSSADGVIWGNETKVLSALGQSNPQGDGYSLQEPCVIREANPGYVMWYSVGDHPAPGQGGPRKIWRATSDNGLDWSNRQLSLPYEPNTWQANVSRPSVVKENDGSYTMFYGAAGTSGSLIGIAGSDDGINWTNRRRRLAPSDLGPGITSVSAPCHFEDVDGRRYLYFMYYDESDRQEKFGRIELGT